MSFVKFLTRKYIKNGKYKISFCFDYEAFSQAVKTQNVYKQIILAFQEQVQKNFQSYLGRLNETFFTP